jgi:hypothetical protein
LELGCVPINEEVKEEMKRLKA